MAIMPIKSMSAIKVLSTRVIYDESKNEASFRVINYGKTPHLVQTWVDSGDAKEEAPFIIIPPVVRLNPDEGQTFRIVYTKDNDNSKNHEVVYWINLLDIPPKSKSTQNTNMMQFAVNTRIKLFYRPEIISSKKPDAKRDLDWVINKKDKNTITATCINKSPFNYTFSNLVLEDRKNNNVEVKSDLSTMCVAQRNTDYEFSNTDSLEKVKELHFHSINDYGGIEKASMKIAEN